MITRMNHVSVFVLDQDSAYEFYVNKLGFKVNTDAPMGPGMRWLTVNPPEQPELEIALMLVDEGSTEEEGCSIRNQQEPCGNWYAKVRLDSVYLNATTCWLLMRS